MYILILSLTSVRDVTHSISPAVRRIEAVTQGGSVEVALQGLELLAPPTREEVVPGSVEMQVAVLHP